ncbi:AAA family ATPase [Actinomadura oligospora]|uniref:AAA family ATPase n=1 Tax=Actinomadura oligospora TaxID=111804 RepID=UPI000479BC5A|nr:AAA family ATPase [Actinomadura oligospora]
MKDFNTAGPCIPGEHYMLEPLARLPEARRLAEQGKYFVIHAPRQTGKTTTLTLLAQALNATGRYAAVRFSCETAKTVEDIRVAEERLLAALWDAAEDFGLPEECMPPDPWPASPGGRAVFRALKAWAKRSPLPLVLLVDEIDALTGSALVEVLSQLRDGATSSMTPFPHSVVLCGMRNVRDYKAASGGDPNRLGSSSPFNISVASLRIGDFSMDEVVELYDQHTEATGQIFEPRAVQRAFEASQGQPWLVNALARDVIEVMAVPVSEPITDDLMDQAVERLIYQRATHLDSLVARLHEPRIQRIIEPMITGVDVRSDDVTYDDDLAYVRDLGLVTQAPPLQISNPIYQEVIIRVLSQRLQDRVEVEPRAFLLPDGRLDTDKLLEEFIAFWKANAEIVDNQHTYHEAACHLAFMAYLQRVVNGGGFIDREYALGRKRLDLTIRKPYTDENGCRAMQWAAYELKVHNTGEKNPIPGGLEQLDRYLDSLGLDTGTLIVFDRRKNAPPVADRTKVEPVESPAGRKITLVRA